MINAFAECNGQYSGWDRNHRAWGANSAIKEGRQTVADIRALVERYCAGVFPELTAAAQPKSTPLIPTATTRVRNYAQEGIATRTAQAEIDARTRSADAATREAQAKIGESTRVASAMLELERQVHAGINQARIDNSSSPLHWNDSLASLAKAHSEDMTNRNYYSHYTPEGLSPTDRLRKAKLSCRKGPGYGIAENITIEKTTLDSPEQTAIEAVQGWLNSSGHRQILLNRKYSETGIGASFGIWRGYRAVYLTQVFCQ